MTKQDILELIKADPWMMNIIHIAEGLNFPDWIIGAGFVRNKVWDHLHGYSNEMVPTRDIDLVYFDPNGNNQKQDEQLSLRLTQETGIQFEIVNQFYAHTWNGLPPYTSTEDSISTWPETATAIGVTIKRGELHLVAPYGIDDMVNLVLRPSPKFKGNIDVVRKRAKDKVWLEKYPKLTFEVPW